MAKATSDKRHVWEVIIIKVDHNNGNKVEQRFNVSARMVNSALSKASRYMKDHKMVDFMIVSLTSIAIVDY